MSAGAQQAALGGPPATGALLEAHLVVRRPGFQLDVDLEVGHGEVVALLGPNGAGKTTALRALAGLLPLSAGHLRLAGRCLDEPAAARFVPAQQRPIGVVFHDYLLFPHLSALDNTAFGPRCHGVRRADARRTAASWLERVGLPADLHRRRPGQLSGGQAQRVALARALAVEPDLLLLDEPLAALDARTRLETRAELHRHLAGHPGAALIVTHDPLDALVLADRLVIIEAGRIVQQGDAATITAQPRTDYVARLVGLNLYRGRADGRTVTLASGFTLAGSTTLSSSTTLSGSAPPDGTAAGPPGPGADVFVAFAPAAVAIHRSRPDGSPRNVWPATVAGVQRHGDNLRVQLAGPVDAAADVTPSAAAQLRLEPGQQVWAAVKATETRVYPAAG